MGQSPPTPPGWILGVRGPADPSGTPSRGPPKKCQKWHFLDPCGAKPRGGGGAPPTTLILLRNQRRPRAPSRDRRQGSTAGTHRTCLRHLAGRLWHADGLAARLWHAYLLASPTATASPRPSRGVSGLSGSLALAR